MVKKTMLIFCILAVFGGCAFRHYFGLHGPSIRTLSDIHDGVEKDLECLACHDPDQNPTGPATSHPQFKGCLKCHNDSL